MAPRPDVTAERTEQIIDAAIAVFNRLGFHKARMDDIAREAGVSKGTLYWYFESKDAITKALLQHLFDEEVRQVETLLTAEGSAGERLLAISGHLADEFERWSKLMAVVYEFYATAIRDPEVQRTLAGFFQTYRKPLAALIQQGIQNGEFRRLDVDAAATAIAAAFEGLALLWTIDPRTVRWREVSSLTMRLLLAGMRADGKE
ncbi:MAG: hypothetical protein CL878_00880 [Dehalococcoidia bacterium]|nr:hypothetical protein [Dehalococcoidia bacterium]